MAGSVQVTISGVADTVQFGLPSGAGASGDQVQRLVTVLRGIASGAYAGNVRIATASANAAFASGTLTISSGSGAVGGTIGGTAKTVTWATSDTASAAALVTAINADTTLNKYVLATSAAGVVTITAVSPGQIGNGITLTASGTGVTASGAKLSGGTGVSSAGTLYSFG